MKFSDMQQQVLRDLIDTPSAVQASVPTLIQNAHKSLQRLHNFYIMKAVKLATTTASTRALVARPTDWKQAYDRPSYQPQYGQAKPVYWAKDSEIVQFYGPADTGSPHYLTDDGTNLNIWPLSNGYSDYDDGQFRLSVPYFKYLPVPSSGGDEDWFMVNAAEFIEYQAAADGFAMDWDEAHSTFWQNRATLKRNEIITADKAVWLGQMDGFVPHKGAFGPRLQR